MIAATPSSAEPNNGMPETAGYVVPDLLPQ